MNQEQFDFTKSAADDGAFIRLSMTVWNPMKSITLDAFEGFPSIGISEKVVCTRKFHVPQISKSKRLLSACKLAVKNLTYKTSYGYFVPAANIERLQMEMEEFRAKIMDARDKILADYDRIIKKTAAEAAKVAVLTWKIKYGHEGKPHSRFVEKFVEDYVGGIGTREDLSRRFRFNIMPSHPILNSDSQYARLIDVDANNVAVCEILYERILNRRRALVSTLLNMEAELKDARLEPPAATMRIFRRLSVRIQGYIWSFFYSDRDPEIVPLLEKLREILIVDDELRNTDTVVPCMRHIITHIVDHPFFRTGLEVVDV